MCGTYAGKQLLLGVCTRETVSCQCLRDMLTHMCSAHLQLLLGAGCTPGRSP
jgi:hypothetical protein